MLPDTATKLPRLQNDIILEHLFKMNNIALSSFIKHSSQRHRKSLII